MPYPKALLERFATSAQSLHRVIENAHKAVKQERINRTRDLLALFYGRHLQLLERDIESVYQREQTKTQMKALMCVNNFTRRVLVESSLAYSEKPVIKIRSKLDDAGGVNKPDPVMPGVTATSPTPPAAPAGADPAKANAPGKGGAPNTAQKQKSEPALTRIWNERIDSRKNFWPVIKEAEPLANGVNDVAIVASYRAVDGQLRMTWDLFTPDTYIVVQQLEAPDEPAVIAFDQYIDDTDPLLMTDQNLITRAFRVIFTKDKVLTANTQTGSVLAVNWFPGQVSDGANPYGFIPLVIMRHGRPEPGSFFGAMAEDLLSVNRQYNLLSTQMRLAEMYQAHGVFWVKGLPQDSKDEVDVAPGAVVELSDEGNTKGGMGYVTANIPIDQMEHRRLNMIREIADNYGMSPAEIMAEGSGSSPRSGKALQVMSERLVERTERFREATEGSVKDLIKKSLLVWKRWNASDPDAALIPEKMDDIEVELRFMPLRREQDEIQAAIQRRQEINDGLDIWENWYMELHPEVENAEEARAIIMLNKQNNAALNPAQQQLTDTIAAMAGAKTPAGQLGAPSFAGGPGGKPPIPGAKPAPGGAIPAPAPAPAAKG